jgi:hypothetical protein
LRLRRCGAAAISNAPAARAILLILMPMIPLGKRRTLTMNGQRQKEIFAFELSFCVLDLQLK